MKENKPISLQKYKQNKSFFLSFLVSLQTMLLTCNEREKIWTWYFPLHFKHEKKISQSLQTFLLSLWSLWPMHAHCMISACSRCGYNACYTWDHCMLITWSVHAHHMIGGGGGRPLHADHMIGACQARHMHTHWPQLILSKWLKRVGVVLLYHILVVSIVLVRIRLWADPHFHEESTYARGTPHTDAGK